MRAQSIALQDETDPYRPVLGSQQALGQSGTSMMRDVLQRKRTEIEAIIGKVVAIGKSLGLALPLNEALVRLMVEWEQSGYSESVAARAEAELHGLAKGCR